ncbi:MAG: STAS domain-containing protein [Candidatus Viridilinea halotolerans]|uniref:STAS domain-containing protein n=1 Tax=Candidatus Viridilinea halotolerans TaxID=2491704 RepID=A0A426TQ56_9CHLR|nr:MAG: STAS domain-containing protein [Candidatus Viridilinea halotolerans]
MVGYLRTITTLLLQPIRLLGSYPSGAWRVDLLAGVTVGLVLLPQALAFSLLAGLPVAMGLYTAFVTAIIGALWGSSSHLHSGPTNTAAILTLSVLAPFFAVGSPEFLAAAGLLAVLSGLIRLLMGLAHLGLLVNFVSDAVAVGFTAGAGLLIISNQLGPILRVHITPTAGVLGTLGAAFSQWATVHAPSLLLGLGTILFITFWPRVTRRVPSVLAGVALLSLMAWLFDLEGYGVRNLGALPAGLPPLASLPFFDLELIGHLINGALAIALIGLVEAVAIARAVAGHSRQRLDSNQEFVGQGMANIAAGLFSGFPASGSFNRSALSYQAGAQTALANAFSGVFVLVAAFALNTLIARIPLAVLAGALAVTAWGMIDRERMAQIWRGARGEALIMTVTFGATLLLPLQFAILTGVLMSLAYYLLRTSTPRVDAVLPDPEFQHWEPHNGRPQCPQLAVVDVLGDIYFGAVHHVEETIDAILNATPSQRFLLLRMHSVQHCDISGIRMLESIRDVLRERGGDLYMTRVRDPVVYRMRMVGFYEQMGPDNFLDEDVAIDHLFYHIIDPAVCIYECERRAFRECYTLPKRTLPGGAPPITLLPLGAEPVPTLRPIELWDALHSDLPPLVVDVREPREFRESHIPGAIAMPLDQVLTQQHKLPLSGRLVLICRSGRRSARAAEALIAQGYRDLRILEGGLLAWEQENLLMAM